MTRLFAANLTRFGDILAEYAAGSLADSMFCNASGPGGVLCQAS